MSRVQEPVRAPASSDRGDAAIRVLIVDDSAVARAMLARAIADHRGFIVVGAIDRAERALAWLAHHRADIVLLDIEMPGRSGLAALPDLIAAGGRAHIVIVSSSAAEGATATLQALSLGAADAIAKPEGGIGRHFGLALTDRLRRIVSDGEPSVRVERGLVRAAGSGPVACVAIGASTGGIHALVQFFAHLPVSFDAPIFVTQHLPPSFMPFFAAQLTAFSGRPAVIARDAMPVRAGRIYVAPGHAHLGCERTDHGVVIRTSTRPAPSRCLPSVDPMFESVAEVYGDTAIGVVLSGMGRDGTDGSGALAAAGASVIVQDSDSAVIWGMPGAVARADLATLIAAPERLAEHIVWRGALA